MKDTNNQELEALRRMLEDRDKTIAVLKAKMGDQEREITGLKDEIQRLQGRTVNEDIHIRADRKIDVIKIFHSMCRIGLFCRRDGGEVRTIDVMTLFGKVLNNNFTDYSSNLSASKAKTKESTFLAVFDELRSAALSYFKKA